MCYSLFLTKREREYASFPREREREREREKVGANKEDKVCKIREWMTAK